MDTIDRFLDDLEAAKMDSIDVSAEIESAANALIEDIDAATLTYQDEIDVSIDAVRDIAAALDEDEDADDHYDAVDAIECERESMEQSRADFREGVLAQIASLRDLLAQIEGDIERL